MLDWVTAETVSGGGFLGLVALLVTAQIRGWIYFKPAVDRMDESYKRQLADAWAYGQAECARANILAEQQQKLLEAAYPVLGKVRDEMA
jgi:hypothetical protein